VLLAQGEFFEMLDAHDDPDELLALVVFELIGQGKHPAEIGIILREQYGQKDANRMTPWQLIQKAVQRPWVDFKTLVKNSISRKLIQRFAYLKRVDVVAVRRMGHRRKTRFQFPHRAATMPA
jgi:hypothetical protein